MTLIHADWMQSMRGKRVVVYPGSGTSAERGIPTFRDALAVLWEISNPAQLPTNEAFRAHPSLCWGCQRRVLGSTTRVGFGLVPSLSLIASRQLAVGHAGYMVSSSFRDGIVKSSPITPCRELEILSNDKSSSSSARTNAYLRRASNL